VKEHQIARAQDGTAWVFRGDGYDDHLALGGHEAGLGMTLEWLLDLTPNYMAVVNVGAHVGTWAVRFAQHRKCVIAYEMDPETADTLRQNASLNGVAEKMLIIEKPVLDKPGVAVKRVVANGRAESGSTRAEVAQDDGSLALSTTLDELDLPSSVESVGLILMDVEGAEAQVLQGATNLLRRDKPVLVIELHEGHPGVSENIREEVEALLDEAGYVWHSQYELSEEHIIAVPKDWFHIDLFLFEPTEDIAGSDPDVVMPDELAALTERIHNAQQPKGETA
jgi:FkbM family methyltransferase